MRVMVVEDEPMIRMDLTFRVEALGHQVVATAAAGRDAITQAREKSPELILMDVQLKDSVSGIEAALAIRGFLPSPIYFLSAYEADQLPRMEEVPPPTDLFSKPLSDQALTTLFDRPPRKEPLGGKDAPSP